MRRWSQYLPVAGNGIEIPEELEINVDILLIIENINSCGTRFAYLVHISTIVLHSIVCLDRSESEVVIRTLPIHQYILT